jgi:diguanylate cyclase (GGDEF)-like protein
MMIFIIIIHCIVNFDTLVNRHYQYDTPVGKSFRMFVIGVIPLYVFDGLWGVFYLYRMRIPLMITSFFYFMMLAITVLLWIRLIYIRFGKITLYIMICYYSGIVYFLFTLVILVINIFNPIVFSVDQQGMYHIYIFRAVLLIIQSILFFASSLYLLHLMKIVDKNMHLHILARAMFGLIMAVLLLAHMTYVPAPFYSIGCLIATCCYYKFIVEKLKDDHYQELDRLLRKEQEYKKQINNIELIANTDPLTGVKSARAYSEAISEIDDLILKDKLQEFGVIVFDVNNLKSTNDKYGHKMGDILLMTAARTIIKYSTDNDLYRIGGDEFVVMLKGKQFTNRKMILADFETEIENNVKNKGVIIASGISIYRPRQDTCYRLIFERADLRMYDCKALLKVMEQSYH